MDSEYIYRRKQTEAPEKTGPAPVRPSMDALRSGAAKPTAEQKGHRVDLPEAMREKMETAFGADLSALKLYESEAVAEAGAGAMAQGSEIAFAPGMLDFSSFGGQALLGHEISHVVSQARGEVAGGGFLNDRALEARADREGALAAAGQQVSAPTASLSPVSADSASGPMQAGYKEDKYAKQAAAYRQGEITAYDEYITAEDPKARAAAEERYNKNRGSKAERLQKLGKTEEEIAADDARTTNPMNQLMRAHTRNIGSKFVDPKSAGAAQEKAKRYGGYLGDLGKIMAHMSDDELRANPQFQKALVDSYAGAHKNGLGADAPGAFIPGEGPDLMGTLYSRLMGADKTAEILAQGPGDAAMTGLTKHMQDTGVHDLLARQYERTYLRDPNTFIPSDIDKATSTMRSFWDKAVAPAAARSPEAAGNAEEMGRTLTGITDEQVQARSSHQYIPRTGKALSAEAGGDFLLNITPNNSGVPYPGPMPDYTPKAPIHKTLELTPEEQTDLDEQVKADQAAFTKSMLAEEKQAKKRFKAEQKRKQKEEKARQKAEKQRQKAEEAERKRLAKEAKKKK